VSKYITYFIFTITILITSLLFTKNALASEGTVELRSTTSEEYRCFVASLQMQDLKFRVLVSCRNLIYPADENVFNYVLWGTPTEGGNPIRFGTLDLGKAAFSTKTAFSNLYVTTERSRKEKSPTGTVVMRGDLQPIEFLEEVTTPTPTPESEGQPEEEQQTQEEQQQELTTRERLIIGLRRAGIVSLLALIAIIGLVFVISRSRG
jgi:hypothetical protein